MLLIGFNLAPAFSLPSAKPLSKDWHLVAASNIIAGAKINAPLKTLRKLQESKESAYINLQLTLHEPAKGKVEKSPIFVREYEGFQGLAGRPGSITKLIGKDVLVFLIFVDDSDGAGIYFTSDGPSTMRSFNKQDLLKIKREVANQNYIVQHFKEFSIAKENHSDKEVRTLLSQLTVAKTQDEAWQKLLKLPRSSVPALIRALDDNRTLGHPQIEIPVPPGPQRFEEIAHYGPQIILDAISILLDDKTNTSFGKIYNGGSTRERQTVSNAWKVWAYYNLSDDKNAKSH
jgi:hypothetical protein